MRGRQLRLNGYPPQVLRHTTTMTLHSHQYFMACVATSEYYVIRSCTRFICDNCSFYSAINMFMYYKKNSQSGWPQFVDIFLQTFRSVFSFIRPCNNFMLRQILLHYFSTLELNFICTQCILVFSFLQCFTVLFNKDIDFNILKYVCSL